jgi:hypothetical protein
MPLYLFSTSDTPPPHDFAIELADDKTALREAALSETDLGKHGEAPPHVTVWDVTGRKLGK